MDDQNRHVDEHLLDGNDDQEQSQPVNEFPDLEKGDLAFLNMAGMNNDADLDVIMGRYFKTLNGMGATLESVFLLMRLGEEATTLERKLLWASESHINVFQLFSRLTSIHEARAIFVRRKDALMAAIGPNPSDVQESAIITRAKESVPKGLNYHVVRSSKEIMEMYQSIAKIEAKSVFVCVNGSGIINLPATVTLPSLTSLKIRLTSGELVGKLPERISCLWIDGSLIPSKSNSLSLFGMSVLQTLIINNCDTLKLLLSQTDKNVPIKIIVSLCKSQKYVCEKHIRAVSHLNLSFRIVIVPDRKYNSRLITENVAVKRTPFSIEWELSSTRTLIKSRSLLNANFPKILLSSK
uniref:Disease resistance protein n=1 Tax=Strongyloides venezuelensis TaxID=75913 RepID=A0A0K0FAW9_STRVS